MRTVKIYEPDLFGEPTVVSRKKPKRKRTSTVVIAFKVTADEYDKVRDISRKFGTSVYRYVRDAVRSAIAEHECILKPKGHWTPDDEL